MPCAMVGPPFSGAKGHAHVGEMASSKTWMLQAIQSTISDIDSVGTLSIDRAKALEWRVELVYRDLLAKEVVGELASEEHEALPHIADAYLCLRELVQSIELLPPPGAQPVQVLDGSVGRPSYHIPYHQLDSLISMHLSVPQIARIVGVSVSTVRRRMSEYNLSIGSTYSTISDADLDAIVRQQFYGWGNRQVYGSLVSLGIRVPHQRVRESQRRVDPEGSIMRRLNRVQRRTYSVPGPQHLWHIDGNHKMIR